MKRLTELAHDIVAGVLSKGDIAIDATAGNGHDTLFLTQQVGPVGTVYAFDIQSEALEATRARIPEELSKAVRLFQIDHAQIWEFIDESHRGCIKAIMFNLGYLPGGDKEIVTRSASTLTALKSATELLQVGGAITILAYPGHAGGEEETTAVVRFLEGTTSNRIDWNEVDNPNVSGDSPRLFVVRKPVQESAGPDRSQTVD